MYISKSVSYPIIFISVLWPSARGLILESRVDIGYDTDFATYYSLFNAMSDVYVLFKIQFSFSNTRCYLFQLHSISSSMYPLYDWCWSATDVDQCLVTLIAH